jgi:hypothetical protein
VASDGGRFDFPTLDAAARAARGLALAEHRRHFVVTQGSRYAAVPVATLEALIQRAGQADGSRLAIVRVATPDGEVTAVDDPGDVEGRLVAFCTSG